KGKGKGLVAVRGTVTLDGKPLAGAMVSFHPVAKDGEKAKQQTGEGCTREDGSFEAYVRRGPAGLAPGTYDVEVGPAPPIVVGDKTEDRFPVPKVYRSRKTTPVRAEVVANQENVLDIRLQSKR